MMRMFWRSLGVVGGLLLLLLIAVAVAVWTVEVNDFVGPLHSRVKESTGRDLAIRGGIELKVSLAPKLVINDVSLGNAAWAQSPQMLVAKRVEVQVALLPLLKRRFEVERFTLVGPIIALETDAAGRGNWEFGGTPGKSAGAKDGASASDALTALSVADFAVSEGSL